MESLVDALLSGDQDNALVHLDRLRGAGVEPARIISEGIEVAMARLDAKCTVEKFNLLEIMLCGRASSSVIRELFPTEDHLPPTQGTIVIGSLEGDAHDLGKNIFKTVLRSKGYGVIDCGKDCSSSKLVDAAALEGALAIGISGLLATVIPQVRALRAQMSLRGLDHVRVLVGGAAFKQMTAAQLHVDFVGENIFDGIRFLDEVCGIPALYSERRRISRA